MDTTELLASTILSFGLPSFVGQFFAAHPYEIIFLCLLVGGGVIIFPSFYLAILGVLNGWGVFAVMVAATLVADSFWYLVGRGTLPSFVSSRIEKGKYVRKFAHITEGKELVFLFYSKFIYGTRIAMQVYCGARKVNYAGFIGVNTIAVGLLGGVYYAVIRLMSVSIESLGDLQHKLPLVVMGAILTLGLFHVLLHMYLKKKFLRR